MKLFGSLFVTLLLCTACASLPEVDSTHAQDIKPVQAERKNDLIAIRKKIKNGRPEDNINYLNQQRGDLKGTEFEPEVEQLLGQEYSRLNKHADAGICYLRAARSSAGAERRFKLCQQAGKSFELAKDWDRLKKSVDYCLTSFEIPSENIRDLKAQKIIALEAEGANPVEISKAYVDLTASSQGELEGKYRGKALHSLEGMDLRQLGEVTADNEFGFLRGHAAYRMGQIYLSQRDTGNAKEAFAKTTQYLPETELAEDAQKKIDQISMATNVNPSTVGAVLPLSGKHAGLGQKLLRGLQMGLGLDGEGITPIKLAIVDSEGNPDLARRGVDKLVAEDNVVAVTGSLLSKTANAVADQAQVLNVPNLSLSQKPGLTQIGENIFRFGMTSEMQVRFLVKKCMKDLGMKRFAILYPNDKFGIEYANLFWTEVLARGGEIRAAQSYEPEEIDFSAPIQRLVGTFYQEERQEEMRWALKLRSEKQKGASSRSKSSDDLLTPVTDFDAIFIADGIKALGQISAMLSYNGVRGSKLLGLNLWNNESIIKRVGNSSNQVLFVDSAPLDTASPDVQAFVSRYKSLFNEDPGVFEVQGFETGLLLSKVLSQNVRSRSDFRDSLKTLAPFKGLSGSVSLKEGREFSKQLYLYSIDNNQIKILN
ncbi:MAG: branched chain amino-acid transporter substrate-binding protein [Pseudomonadota bacterium]|jgi:ABC-type branched-subunit amino acid transport system substrate-binding protein